MARGIPDAAAPAGCAFRRCDAGIPASRRAWFPEIGWVETPVIDRAELAARPRARSADRAGIRRDMPGAGGVDAALDAFGNIRLTRG